MSAKHCPRGHELSGHNRLPGRGGCRACTNAFLWAKRHHRFYDDPQVVEHANRLVAQYLDRKEAAS